jgi:hypothetical protein
MLFLRNTQPFEKMKWIQLFIALTSCIVAACASNPEGSNEGSNQRGDCIRQSSIRGYRVLDEQNLIVEASGRKKYHVALQRRAFGLRSSWAIGFVDSPTGRVCAGFSEIVFDDRSAGGPIRVAAVRQLTPAEEENLLIQFGLKEPEVKPMPVPQEVQGADIEELDPDADE